MITIAKRVEEIIEQWPMLNEALKLNLLNTSSVARYLKPEVEKASGERISEAAVLMALRRYEKKKFVAQTSNPRDFLGDISLRSDLVDLTYFNSPNLSRRIASIAHQLGPQHYFTSSRGLLQTSVIVHKDHLEFTKNILIKEHLAVETLNLTSITLHLKTGHDNVAGILAYPLQLLAWRGITVVEVVSTYDELNLSVYDQDVETAFSTINSAIKKH